MRVRLLPLVLVAATLLLGVRLGGIWTDARVTLGTPQAVAAGKSEKRDAPKLVPAPLETPRPPSQYEQEDEEASAAVLKELETRRKEIEKREKDLEMREGVLKAAEKRLDEKLAQLTSIKTTVEGLLKKHDQQRTGQLKSIVAIYEKMKPKDAARVFEEMDMIILVEVLDGMKETKSAPILSEMDPVKVKDITARLAARRGFRSQADATPVAATGGLPALPGQPLPTLPGQPVPAAAAR